MTLSCVNKIPEMVYVLLKTVILYRLNTEAILEEMFTFGHRSRIIIVIVKNIQNCQNCKKKN